MNLFKFREPEKKNSHSKNGKKETGKSVLPVLKFLPFIIFVTGLYLTASIFSFWTGQWGRIAGETLLRTAGGPSMILLLYVLYISAAFIFKKEILKPFSQAVGTILLLVGTSILLGLFDMMGTDLYFRIFRPGISGKYLAEFITARIGTFGAILFTFTLAVLSAALYGFVKAEFLKEKGIKVLSLLKKGSKYFTIKDQKENVPGKNKMKEEKEKISTKPDYKGQPDHRENHNPSQNSSHNVPDKIRNDQDEIDQYVLDEESDYAEPDLFETEEQAELQVEPGHFPPPLDLYGPDKYSSHEYDRELIAEQGEQIIRTLEQFGIEAELAETVIGPTVIQFQLQLAPGIKVSRVAGLSNDLAVALAVPSLRVEAPIPFKPYVGIEIPNPQRASVPVRNLLGNEEFTQTDHVLPLIAGLRVNSRPLVINLEELPHLLVAGTTGSGKSVFINSCITGLCSTRKPEELRLLMIDPKRVELTIYEKLPHVLAKPVVDPRKAIHALGWAVREMEHRYEVFARSRVKNITTYNSKALPKDRMPRIVIIIDELADLMFTAQKEVEDFICRIAQMARATGIHLIIATQRPSVNVITGLIKANIPARVAFTLPSQADSRTIIDLAGAEKLLGRGDMLFVSSKYPRPLRVQAAYMDEAQSMKFVNYMKDLFGDPEYVDLEDQGDRENTTQAANLDDPLLEEAINIVLDTGIASASRLQRQLRIGFTRAARLIDTMENMGIVGPPEGSKPRDILVDEDTANSILEENMK